MLFFHYVNVKLMKKFKRKVQNAYECKSGTLLGNSKLKEIIESKPITDLIYR